MSDRHQPIEFPPSERGDLATRPSADRAGLGNYVLKRDWRYDTDQEVRREGDTRFVPPGGAEGQHPFPNYPSTSEPITLEFTARRPNGQTAFICGTATKLFRYFHYEDGLCLSADYVEAGYAQNLTGIWLVIGSGFSASGHRWEAEYAGGQNVFNNGVDLMVSYRLEDFSVVPMWELREQGIAYVDSIGVHAGILMLFGVAEIRADFLPGIMNGPTPYGPISDPAVVNYIRYRKMWSSVSDARRFGAGGVATIVEGSTALVLQYPIRSLAAGDEVLVFGAGEEGGNLLTTVQFVNGTTVGLKDYARTAITKGFVSKSDFEGLIVGNYDLEDDASPIVRGISFQDRIVVFKASGTTFVGEYTGDPTAPFVYQRVHRVEVGQTSTGPFFRWALSAPGGQYLLYPGRDGFYTFDLVARRPVKHPKLSLCDNLFFDAVSPADMEKVFAVDVPLTEEIWICFPSSSDDKGICFDYGSNRVSTLGQLYTAGAMIARPVAPGTSDANTDDWLALGLADGSLVRYGMTTTGERIWQRRGLDYNSDLHPGRGDFGDPMNEKGIDGYLLLLSSQSPEASITVEFYGATNPGGAITLLESRTFSAPQTRNYHPTHRLLHLIQDRLRATGASNVCISNRVFSVELVNSRSVVRK